MFNTNKFQRLGETWNGILTNFAWLLRTVTVPYINIIMLQAFVWWILGCIGQLREYLIATKTVELWAKYRWDIRPLERSKFDRLFATGLYLYPLLDSLRRYQNGLFKTFPEVEQPMLIFVGPLYRWYYVEFNARCFGLGPTIMFFFM